MNKKIQSFDAYVVYHNGPDGKDTQPIFCKGTSFEDKCTCDFIKAKVFWRLSMAERAAARYNDEAKADEHPLAGKFKIGRLCVEEMVQAEV